MNKTNARWDVNHEMWLDIRVNDIQDIHKASLMGGRLKVYEVYDSYYMAFLYKSGKVNINFYGLQITKEHYDNQTRMWLDSYYDVRPGTELLLADNTYFI